VTQRTRRGWFQLSNFFSAFQLPYLKKSSTKDAGSKFSRSRSSTSGVGARLNFRHRNFFKKYFFLQLSWEWRTVLTGGGFSFQKFPQLSSCSIWKKGRPRMLGRNSWGRGARPQGVELDQIFDIENFQKKHFSPFQLGITHRTRRGWFQLSNFFLAFQLQYLKKISTKDAGSKFSRSRSSTSGVGAQPNFRHRKIFKKIFFLLLSWE
jgi:hypothetical protein